MIDMDSIENKIINILCEKLVVFPHEVKLTSDLTNDLSVDSIDILDIIATLEKEFNIKLDDEEKIRELSTVSDLVSYVESVLHKYNEDIENTKNEITKSELSSYISLNFQFKKIALEIFGIVKKKYPSILEYFENSSYDGFRVSETEFTIRYVNRSISGEYGQLVIDMKYIMTGEYMKGIEEFASRILNNTWKRLDNRMKYELGHLYSYLTSIEPMTEYTKGQIDILEGLYGKENLKKL